MADDPFAIFDSWLADAETTEINDPNAMTLATVDKQGRPSARMVLLKGHGTDGFTFYTNQQSRKAGELDGREVALLFHWKSRRRQIRIEGPVAPVEPAVADAYFATRGRASRLGAWASDQSRPLPDRATLEARLHEIEARFEGQDVPRPPHWSGYRVTPRYFEFWEDGAHRLHDRRVFERQEAGWRTGLLYP